MLSLAIYTNSKNDLSIANNLRETIVSELGLRFFDFFFFTDNIFEITNYNTAILPTFYMEFYKDYLVFTNINDYLLYKDRLLTKNICLYIDSVASLPEHIDRNLLRDLKYIFTNKNDKILMVQL